jgi:hypothetical protein
MKAVLCMFFYTFLLKKSRGQVLELVQVQNVIFLRFFSLSLFEMELARLYIQGPLIFTQGH